MKVKSPAALGCGSGVVVVLLGVGSPGVATGAQPLRTIVSGGQKPAPVTVPAGVYAGAITDPDGEPDTYRATIHITAPALKARRRAGTVVYSAATNDTNFSPALTCRARLTYLGRSGARFGFREAITGGASAQCISGGTVTLTRITSRVFSYRWTKRGFPDPAPTGRLTRQGPQA